MAEKRSAGLVAVYLFHFTLKTLPEPTKAAFGGLDRGFAATSRARCL
jgi:hypothetical protein